jgi:hypothetical protein
LEHNREAVAELLLVSVESASEATIPLQSVTD